MFVSTLVSILVGVPLGIAAGHRPQLNAALRPALDLMQTLPTFVYLIPTLVLFGLGVVRALISTVIFALPSSSTGSCASNGLSADSGADNGTRNGSAASVAAPVGGTSIQNPR